MKIAVTGASGFIGTELLAYMAGMPETEIIALTRGGSACADSPLAHDGEGNGAHAPVIWRKTDYSEESLASALDGAETVIHLAGVRGTTSDPDDYVINEIMTENLLRGMDKAGVRRIVFASTISVYDDVGLIPWDEESPLKGRTMYGESKIRCERLIRKHAETSEGNLSYAIVRIAQVLGLGERRRGMMNVFLDTARNGGQIKVMGRSEAKRQYLYVKDLVRILAVLADTAGGQGCERGDVIVNAGMPAGYTNLEIAQIINRVCGNTTPIDYDDSTPETIRASVMNIGRLTESLDYHPMDMEEAIRDIIS